MPRVQFIYKIVVIVGVLLFLGSGFAFHSENIFAAGIFAATGALALLTGVVAIWFNDDKQ